MGDPILVHDGAGAPVTSITDLLSADLIVEVNGEETLTVTLPEGHPAREWIQPERIISHGDERYRVRSITSSRTNGVAVAEVYCQAGWYDLRTAGQLDARDWSAVQPATVLPHILAGTGWTIGAVTVTTTRTWSMSEGDPLTCLRRLADVHGGDLIFDSQAKTVSLLTFSGRQLGLTLIYGAGLTSAKRVVDTTTLMTRIYARNADGVTIADANGGVPYLEDYSYTAEVKTGIYDFASGTSPYLMLTMTQAALGKRAKPSVSYECEVIDLSSRTGQDIDRPGVGDEVRVVDAEMGIDHTERIIRMEHDLLRPWRTKVVLSEKLRELGSSDSADAGVLTTGSDIDTRDLVPFNLLLNARFDNGLAHWAAANAAVVAEGKTGPNAVEVTGGTTGWIEQTVAPDNRDTYMLSLDVESEGYPTGVAPELTVTVEVTYDDGTTETLSRELT